MIQNNNKLKNFEKMEHVMKYKTKSVFNSQPIQYLKVNKKNIQNNNPINSGNIEENIKFLSNRQFGNDLTTSLKNEIKPQNQKATSNNNNQNQNKVNNIYIIIFSIIQTQIYIKKLSPSSQIIHKVNKKRLKINNTKKSSSIYQNKTNLILDKRKSSIINNKNISSYATKHYQNNCNNSMIRHKINTKKNNSVCFVSGYQNNKANINNSKINENTSNNNSELNTTNFELL